MTDRVLVKEKDLLHIISTMEIPELPGITLDTSPGSEFTEEGENVLPENDQKVEDSKFAEEMECVLLSLSIISQSTHRLYIQNPTGFLYSFRNIYLAGEGILVVDRLQVSDCIRFSLVPFIPLAIGAVSSCGEATEEMTDEMGASSQTLHITEESPEGSEEYDSLCRPGREPEEISRMVRFLIYSHQTCLKGALEHEPI